MNVMSARFQNLSLRVKMFLAPSLLLLVLVGLTLYTVLLLASNERHIAEISEGAFKRAALVAELSQRVSAVHARLYQLTSIAANDSDVTKVDVASKALSKDLAGITDNLATTSAAMGTDPQTQPLVTSITKTLKDYVDAAQQVISMASNSSYALIFMSSAQQAYDTFGQQDANLIMVVEGQKTVLVDTVRGETHRGQVIFLASAATAAIVSVLVSLLLGNLVSRPVVVVAQAMRRLAGGELDVETLYTDRQDEIGAIANAFRVFKETAGEAARLTVDRERQQQQQEQRARHLAELALSFDHDVSVVLSTVASAADELQTTAGAMASNAEQTSLRSNAAAIASEQASDNVNSVASATTELSASVSEIGRQVALSTEVAGQAVAEAEQTNQTIRRLAESSQKIGQVVAFIDAIASQTNLLALNATIEAARAGEAGKGFAVVASEVKSLADQTARATKDIAAQIAGMQHVTNEAVGAIEHIGTTVDKISKIAVAIAAAVDQQGAATSEIARNISEVSMGTAEVSTNIGGVSEAASATGTAANMVLEAATRLTHQSETLHKRVDHFLAEVRAA
jgi:methyl-accepting chemotaxis protein